MWEHLQVKHIGDSGSGRRDTGGVSEQFFPYLAGLGRAGWEMVAATTLNEGELVMFFKRPYQAKNAAPEAPPKSTHPFRHLTVSYL
ncbi:MAG: hypothetical protein QOE93_1054 [Actinomycetota bacterium]|jgi:hypothetical protein|nr:hypothetical protein [Actinomycetota bacterium]